MSPFTQSQRRLRPTTPVSSAGRAAALLRGLLVTALLLLATVAAAQEYRWEDVRQHVTIRPDGVVEVSDERTLRAVDGDFGEAFICIEHTGGQRIELLPSTRVVAAPVPGRPRTQACESGAAGTEVVMAFDRRIREAKIRFDYLLHGSVDFYGDVVQWYWQIFGPDESFARGYELIVDAPGAMEEPFDAYVHRFGNTELPEVELSEGRDRLSVSFRRIPEGDGVEIRYLMDPRLFEVTGEGLMHELLLVDESRIAGLRRAREHALPGIRGAAVTALVAVTVVVPAARQ